MSFGFAPSAAPPVPAIGATASATRATNRMDRPSIKIDSLLEPLLLPASDQETDTFLSRLIAVHVQPVIKRVIRYKLHLSSQDPAEGAEADDIHQEVLLQLLTELRQLREQPEAYPIS